MLASGFVLAAVIVVAAFCGLTFLAWRQYLWAARASLKEPRDTCPYSLTDVFGDSQYAKVPHQRGTRWLTDVFSRSAERFPDFPALHIPRTGETLTFADLDARADSVAATVAPFLTGPDQVVAVAMSQDNWQIVAAHLGVLRAGGTLVFIDSTLPDDLITHMLNDAQPVVVLTNAQKTYRALPTVDVSTLPEHASKREPPSWLDDPTQRLATIFYTSGTTGMPKGVECPHAGYVNLALSYADYFDLVPGMDATSLTSSLGYDGSISEMYSAWVSGCAVVMLTKEEIRSGPELIPILREAEVTVLFCPPVLLTTLTSNPEVDLPYPICRYIVPAGEAFPSTLVEPWTRARRQIINTYGPTEASTDTSRQSLRPGEPITIGSPFPNVTYVILEIDQLRPLPHGDVGELCIGGIHVARGYRNLPEQTARKFITHPTFGRLYRTGDKCKIDIKTQRVHFLGRIDTQLKVRGHRVEAQAVEDLLQDQFSEIEAVVLDYQNGALVAFVAAPSLLEGNIHEAAPAPAEWVAHVTAILERQLPGPSIPTHIFLVEKFAMKEVSGKIDRKRLPDVSQLLAKADAWGPRADLPAGTRGGVEGGATPPESKERLGPACEEVLAICRAVFEAPLGWDDEFSQAGGHSIIIARLAQRLQAAGWAVSVRALLSERNTARKVAQIERQVVQARAPETIPPSSLKLHCERDEAAAEVLPVGYFTALQLLFAIVLFLPGMLVLVGAVSFIEIGTFFSSGSIWEFLFAGAAVYLFGLVLPFATLFWVMMMKGVLGGDIYSNNISPGAYPKWSKMHLRVWRIARMEALVLSAMGAMYRSAPLMAFVLRQLGASVGKNLQCANNVSLAGPLDFITIGDNVAIQTGAYIHAMRWSGPNLLIGPIHLGSGCKIGMRAAIADNVSVGSGTWITPFCPILNDVGPGEMWEGAPARLVGRYTELKRTANICKDPHPIWFLEAGNLLMQFGVSIALGVIPAAAIAWSTRDFVSSQDVELAGNYSSTGPLGEVIFYLAIYAFITTWLTIVVTSVLDCLFIRFTAAAPGLHSPHGLGGALLLYRMSKLNRIQTAWTWTITGQYLRALAGLRFTRIGASECDIMFNLLPETASADAQVFWSNGCFTNMLDHNAHHLTLRHLDMPRNFFSGNNCVAEYGQLPTNFLLGVSTPCSEIGFRRQMRSRLGQPITVAGNPPVRFASASFEAENANGKLPDFPIFFVRALLNDIVSIGQLRVTEALIFAVLFTCLLRTELNPIACAITAVVLTEAGLVWLSVAVKRVLVGNDWGANHATPFWSWQHFAYFFSQDCFFAWCRGPLAFYEGTILANPILRLMGCKIGPRTIVSTPMQCSDWNAVSFGADCVVGGFLQFHTFENMTLKVKRTFVKDGCTVAFGATVMGGVTVERDSTLLPLSMVLKEMSLPTGTYDGSPVEPVFAASGSTVSPNGSQTHRLDEAGRA